MTEPTRHRLTLLLAIAGALTIVLQLSVTYWGEGLGSTMPVFHKSAPDVRDWPGHIYLPIG
jgi:hypothetical protein